MKRTPEMKLLSIALTLIMVFVSYFAMPAKAIANEIENAALTDAIEAYADATDFSQDNRYVLSMNRQNKSSSVWNGHLRNSG